MHQAISTKYKFSIWQFIIQQIQIIKINNEDQILDLDNLNVDMKFGKGRDYSWNEIKRYIASMQVKEECFDAKNNAIHLTAIWNSKEITNLNNQIALDDAYIDLFASFDEEELERLEKKYPNVYSTENPNYLIDIIKEELVR